MKDNFLAFCYLKSYIHRTKKAHQSEIFRLLNGRVKIDQIPSAIFETINQFFFKLCITLQYHER